MSINNRIKNMFSTWSGPFIIIIQLTIILKFNHIKCDTAINPTVTSNSWKKIEDNWPNQDRVDEINGKNSEFYFLNETGLTSSNWKINNKFITDDLHLLSDKQTIKLSFKYWSSGAPGRTPMPLIYIGDNIAYPLYDRYKSNYINGNEKYWMPFEIIMSKKQLNYFEFNLNPNKNKWMAAIKDFEVEYEEEIKVDISTLTQIGNIQTEDIKPDTTLTITSLPTSTSAPPTFPEDCFITETTAKSKKICGYNLNSNYDYSQSLTKINISNIDADLENCFNIKIFSQISSKINVYVSGIGDKTLTKIRRLQPFTSSIPKFHYNEKICLSDLSYLSYGKFKVKFEIELNNPLNEKEFFSFLLEKDKNIVEYKKQSFLTNMGNDLNNQWGDEWEEEKSPNFFTNDLGMQFKARTYSEEISISSLIGKPWLLYNPQHFKNNFHIILNVTDPKDYNSFNLKPKICTDFFHCFDAFITNIEETSVTIKNISFNFNTKINSKFIKLMIDVEYLKPSYEYKREFYDIDFIFQLINFGDPCANFKCGEQGNCIITSPKNDLDIKRKCKCAKGYIGDNLCEINYCQMPLGEKKIYGQNVCDKIIGNPDCISLKEKFRCACDDDTNPNWNPDSLTCEPVKIGLVQNWKVNDPDTFDLFPNATDNYFRLKFNEIHQKNISIVITYSANVDSNLAVEYVSELNKPDSVSMNYFLKKSTAEKDENVEIFLRDFRYFYDETFSLSFSSKITNPKLFNEESFKIIDVQTKFNDFIKADKLQKWDSEKDNNFNSIWKRLSNGINSNKIDGLFIGKGENATITFISNWIETNPYIINKNSESYFKLLFNNNLGKQVIIKTRILYHTNEKNIELSKEIVNEIINDDRIKKANPVVFKLENFPSDIFKYFKIVLEITMESKKENEETFTISLSKISIGDPCFKELGTKPVCKSNACKAESPNPLDPLNKNMCGKCIDSSGLYCDWKNLCQSENSTRCDNFIYGMPSNDRCSQIIPNDFQCSCSNNYFEWDVKNKNCWRKKQFKTTKVRCERGSCPFISNDFTSIAIWANKDISKIDETSKNNLYPFYFTNKKDSQLSLQFKASNYADICVTLKYKTTGNSNISIFYDGNSPLNLMSTIQDQESYSEQTICLSDLAQPAIQNFAFNLKFEQGINDEMAILNLKEPIIPDKINSSLLSALPYLEQISFNNKVDRTLNLWTLRIPSKNSEWGQNQFIFKTQYFGNRQSSLFSHWIEKSKNTMFRSKIFDLKSELNYTIDFILIDNKLSEIPINTMKIDTKIKEDINNKKGFVLQSLIPEQQNPFRFKIRVNYNNPKTAKNSQLVNELFTLDNIDIGDPCVLKNLSINTCTGRGDCNRNLSDTEGYTCKCRVDNDTKQRFMGKNCEMKDNCASPDKKNKGLTGIKVCESFKSACVSNGDTYSCKCPGKDNYWDINENNCLPIPKCLNVKCNQNEICDESTNGTCKCDEDYILNKSTKLCEIIDPCNHNEKKCTNPNSFCQPISWGINGEWDCLCDEGFEKTGGGKDITCSSIVCDKKWLNKCQQKCEPNSKNDTKELFICSCYENYFLFDKYNCKVNTSHPITCNNCTEEDKYCDPLDKSCKCNPRLITEKDNSCSIDKNLDINLCPTGNLTKDSTGKFVHCDCGDNYIFNKETLLCELKPICGEGGIGRQHCDKLNKICVLNMSSTGFFDCKCLDQQFEQDKTCVNQCEHINKTDKKSGFEKCAEKNAKCNPYSKDLCECNQGFVKNKEGICVAVEYASKFTLNFKDDLTFLNCNIKSNFDLANKIDLSSYKKDQYIIAKDLTEAKKLNKIKENVFTSQMRLKCLSDKLFEVIINYIKKFDSEQRMEPYCEKQNKSEYIDCTFSLVFNDVKERNNSILTNLKNSCISYDNENCFIPLASPKTYSLSVSKTNQASALILDKNSLAKLELNNIGGCDQNNCQGYSNCIPFGDTAYHSCICDTNYFKVESSSILKSTRADNPKFKIETCKENFKCPASCKTCVRQPLQKPQKTGNWTIDFACNCAEKSTFNGKECVDSCSGIQCKNGEKKFIDGVCQCVCNERFYGVACDSEYSAGKGGWIAGIVVLAVLVVILAGVAFMFARRSRNNSSDYSGRPMDDYTGSSYRVPPNQSRGQQNPTFTRD